MNDLAEKIASAMCASLAWPVVFQVGAAQELTRAALAAIEAKGYRIVPARPFDTSPSVVEVAAANYRAKTLERELKNLRAENDRLRAAFVQTRTYDPERLIDDLRANANRQHERICELVRERDALELALGRLRYAGAHQVWCGMFGETVGWNDALIHAIEPFMMRFVRKIHDDLRRAMAEAKEPTE